MNGYLARVVAVVVWRGGVVVVLSMKSFVHSNDSIDMSCLLVLLLVLLLQFLLLQIGSLHVGSYTVVVVEDGYGKHLLCSLLANNIFIEMLYNLICMQTQYVYAHTNRQTQALTERGSAIWPRSR